MIFRTRKTMGATRNVFTDLDLRSLKTNFSACPKVFKNKKLLLLPLLLLLLLRTNSKMFGPNQWSWC
jgi:hypothetical protein